MFTAVGCRVRYIQTDSPTFGLDCTRNLFTVCPFNIFGLERTQYNIEVKLTVKFLNCAIRFFLRIVSASLKYRTIELN